MQLQASVTTCHLQRMVGWGKEINKKKALEGKEQDST
jgi:hypothetical protein